MGAGRVRARPRSYSDVVNGRPTALEPLRRAEGGAVNGIGGIATAVTIRIALLRIDGFGPLERAAEHRVSLAVDGPHELNVPVREARDVAAGVQGHADDMLAPVLSRVLRMQTPGDVPRAVAGDRRF